MLPMGSWTILESPRSNPTAGRPDYWGRTRDVPSAAASSIFGLKVTGVDVDRQRMFRQFEFEDMEREIRREIFSIQRNQGLSDAERKAALDKVQKKIDALMSEREPERPPRTEAPAQYPSLAPDRSDESRLVPDYF